VNNLLPGNVGVTTGNDILSGTTGSTLTGGTGTDTFYFTTSNTGNGATTDHIANFSQANSDKIDLHGFGLTAANFNSSGTLTGSSSFTSEQLTNAAGHPYTLVMIETNGSHTAQYEIQLDNVHVSLHANDFTFV
jgi:Ca2+-binding RTX toxin-like protein